MITVSLQDLERDPAGLLDRVEAGEWIVVFGEGRPVAEIRPRSQPSRVPRPSGLAAGTFTVPDDFDDPLPDDIRGMMRLLLDPHVFLWYITADPRLPAPFLAAITDPMNEVHLNHTSIWKVVIKHGLGRLPLPVPPAESMPRERDAHGIASLPIDEGAMIHLAGLPSIHRDPFDRLLIVQAQAHGLTVASVDSAFAAYPVALLPPT